MAEDLAGVQYVPSRTGDSSVGVTARDANGRELWFNPTAGEVFPVPDDGPLPTAFGYFRDTLGLVDRATGAAIGTPVTVDVSGNWGPTAATATATEVMFVRNGAAWLSRLDGHLLHALPAQNPLTDAIVTATASTEATAITVTTDATQGSADSCSFRIRKEASSGRVWEAVAKMATSDPLCYAQIWPTADGGAILHTYIQGNVDGQELWRITSQGVIAKSSFPSPPSTPSSIDVDGTGLVAYVSRENVLCSLSTWGFCAVLHVSILDAAGQATEVAHVGGPDIIPEAYPFFGRGQLWIGSSERASVGAAADHFIESLPMSGVQNGVTGSLNLTRPFERTGSVPPAPTSGLPYVALGDSYSSGEGAFDYFLATQGPTNRCHRSSWSYPYRAQALVPLKPGTFAFVACSGAVTQDLFRENHQSYTDQPAQFDSLGLATKWVTITMGGNDAGFAHVLTECVGQTTSDFGCSKDQGLQSEIDNKLGALSGSASSGAPSPSGVTSREGTAIYSIKEVVRSIHEFAPNATIYWAGYPQLFGTDRGRFSNFKGAPSGRACKVGGGTPFSTYYVDYQDAQWLNYQAARINAAIMGAVDDAKAKGWQVRYVNPRTFLLHGVCDRKAAWLNAGWGDISAQPLPESFHPTQTGMDSGYLQALKTAGWPG